MRLRLQRLQDEDDQVQKVRTEQPGNADWQEVKDVLHYQGLTYVSEIIRTELISRDHDNRLADHFGIKKIQELVVRKYYWPILRRDVKDYVRGYDVCIASKTVRHKLYRDLQSLPVPIHRWKNLSIDFVTGLPISRNWKRDRYDSILVIVDQLTKMIHYKSVKVTINAPGLAEVIINVVERYHGLPNLIVTDRGFLFTSKFWSLLCYFLGIKQKLSTAFHLQTDGQTKKQNSTMEAYLRPFVNFEQNN